MAAIPTPGAAPTIAARFDCPNGHSFGLLVAFSGDSLVIQTRRLHEGLPDTHSQN
jgi:hypothetical protein